MILLLGSFACVGVFLSLLVCSILRRRHREALLQEYCNGFRDGVAYEAKVQAEQNKRAVIKTVMSLN